MTDPAPTPTPTRTPPAPMPPANTPPGDVTPERFSQLEAMVTELGTLLRGVVTPPNSGGGDGTGSAAAGAASPPPVPTDRTGIRNLVRELLEDDDRDARVSSMAAELEDLRTAVADKLTPPKRGWGSWIVGAR